MNCDGAYCVGSVCAPYLSVVRIRGELAMRAHFRATDLYAVGSFDSNHDAVMRIGGEAPGGGPILSPSASVPRQQPVPATSDLNSAVMLKASASAEWC